MYVQKREAEAGEGGEGVRKHFPLGTAILQPFLRHFSLLFRSLCTHVYTPDASLLGPSLDPFSWPCEI